MPRPLLILGGILLVVVVGTWLVGVLTPEESKVQAVIERLVEHFNDESPSGFESELSKDYEEEIYRVGPSEVRRYLSHLFMTQMQEKTTRYRAEFLDLKVELTGELAHATVVGKLFPLQGAGVDKPTWVADVELGLRKVDGDWKVFRSRFKTTAGSLPR